MDWLSKIRVRLANYLLYGTTFKVLDWWQEYPELPKEASDHDREIVDAILEKRLTGGGSRRLFTSLSAAKYAINAGIEGDFVECGVYKGGNSLALASVLKHLDPESLRRLWMYDTFTGMTTPTQFDFDLNSDDSSNELAAKWAAQNKSDGINDWCYCARSDVETVFREFGYLDKCKIVEGDVLKTMLDENNLPEKIAVLRLDTDFYDSTKMEMEILYPRLQQGGVLLIDDYGCWGGSKKAVDDYFLSIGVVPFLACTDLISRSYVKL